VTRPLTTFPLPQTTMDSVGTAVVGSSVKSFHTYQNMSFWDFRLPNGTEVQTCPAALGYGFAGGVSLESHVTPTCALPPTPIAFSVPLSAPPSLIKRTQLIRPTQTTDGPGFADFVQGESGTPKDPLWNIVRDVLRTPTPEQVACQQPKPVLLDVGEMYTPYAWSPNIIDVQSLRVGQFVIIISPSEATTMAGRRWRDAVQKEAAATILSGSATPKVVLGGPANSYAVSFVP
jgi:neutral ceramidase